ncbi:hybrid sensor histidine kinase/response regulator [Stutzerimonas nosocomialis]|uniref:hybrid sensor histidine kinase/response regulator n=1 Tax=Stutzerimonas nosocomialis TaxID=1056496 RepID=UPI001109A07C|nr:hybrid sensor histidine kinase/response regulator [Stutzerimonas nosocomialis]TLX60491.1 hybrid sensor histidine kinase/response regulator [Stutzerimonas nosocomialis]
MARYGLALLLLCLSVGCWAADTLSLPSGDFRLPLGQWAESFEDPGGRLDAAQVLALAPERFQPVDSRHVNKGKNDSTWWFRVRLDNPRTDSVRGFVEINYPLLDHIELYVVDAQGRLAHQLAGDDYPFEQRAVKVRNFWFPVELAPGPTTLLVKVHSTSSLFVPLYFSTYGASAAAQERTTALYGGFYGILLAMFCYNLFLFLSLREPAYFWYLVYNLNIGLFAASFDGLLFKVLPGLGTVHGVLIYLLMLTHCFTSVQFSRHFLHTREHFPRLDRLLRGVVLISFAGLVAGLLIPLQTWSILASLAVLGTSIGLLLTGAYAWHRGVRYGSYYILAWGILLASFIIVTAGSLGFELFGVYGSSVVKVSVAIELITLSIGLADRINQLKEEGYRSRQAAAQARIENKAKSRFLAKMSHEIRTPLSGLLGMLQLLRETRLDGSQRFYVDTISSSGRSLMTVINDILDYARIESGKLVLEDIEFDLETLVSEATSLFTAQAQEKQLGLYISLDPGVPRMVRGDPTRLKQVLLNLLSNAVKFTENGHVALKVSRSRDGDGPMRLLFAVIDTGIGIHPNAVPQLFESFAQETSSTSRRYGGSGLGLAISKELVELMGGTIEVQSTPGEGSRFLLSLPSPDLEQPADPLAERLAARRALLASSDPQALDALACLLQRWGMHCDKARTLADCLEQLDSHDLLVLVAPLPGQPSEWFEALEYCQPPQAPLLLLDAPNDRTPPRPVDVSVALPLAIAPLREALHGLFADSDASCTPPPPPPPARQRSGDEQPCVLVAEDNPVNQMVVRGFLEKRGYRVELVDNGQQALDLYRGAPSAIQAIVMDCEMPEMDGFEASRQIRALEAQLGLAPVPIIALTAHLPEEQRERGTLAGMNEFLGKPFDHLALHERLDHYLRETESTLGTAEAGLK